MTIANSSNVTAPKWNYSLYIVSFVRYLYVVFFFLAEFNVIKRLIDDVFRQTKYTELEINSLFVSTKCIFVQLEKMFYVQPKNKIETKQN